MKHLIPVLTALAILPNASVAQINIDFEGTRPVLRANVAGMVVSASVGPRGNVEWRVNEGGTTVNSRGTTVNSRGRGGGSARAAAVLGTADQYVGTKYVWGGASPSGFDCSGFVQYVFRRHGIELPRTSRQQVHVGQSVGTSLSALQVGDLMFFATNGTRIDHIAIYAGNDQIIHSSSSGGGVGYDDLSSKRGRWFADHHVATRRVLEDGQSLVGPLTAALRALAEFDPPDRAPRR